MRMKMISKDIKEYQNKSQVVLILLIGPMLRQTKLQKNQVNLIHNSTNSKEKSNKKVEEHILLKNRVQFPS